MYFPRIVTIAQLREKMRLFSDLIDGAEFTVELTGTFEGKNTLLFADRVIIKSVGTKFIRFDDGNYKPFKPFSLKLTVKYPDQY